MNEALQLPESTGKCAGQISPMQCRLLGAARAIEFNSHPEATEIGALEGKTALMPLNDIADDGETQA